MKKLFVSTGIAALGIAGLQSACGQGLDLVSSKAWSISGTLRGFYDDNYNLANSTASGGVKGSWGAEISPSVSVNLPLRQTDMGFRYIYGLYYYDDRREIHINHYFDQSHQGDFWLDHAFNERWKLNFTDTFTYSRQPNLVGLNGGTLATYRTLGDNSANHATVEVNTQWTPMFSTSVTYGNDWYNYNDSGAGLGPSPGGVAYGPFSIDPGFVGAVAVTPQPSLKGQLDRIEQNAGIDFQWTFSPETMVYAGYDYSWANYTGDEPIATFYYFTGANPNVHTYVYNSSSRNGDTHNAHIGLKHSLTPDLMLALQAGVAYSDNSNDPFQHTQNVSPVASASLTYTYSPGDYVQLGLTQSHNATDVVDPGADGSLTQYQETTVIYGDLNHKITDKLSATVIGRGSYSSFDGGAHTTASEVMVDASINLTYAFNNHFSADCGYNFDDLFSAVDSRGFSHNRVYLGMTASY